jgi:predicted transcriptional regulator
MAQHEKEDRTARAIRERRERAGITQIPATTSAANTVVPLAPQMVQQIPTRVHAPARSRISEDKKAEIRREIESLKDRPVDRARKLAYYFASGLSQGEIASALGVGQPWVSKRIALTQASKEVLQKIEMGALSETAYYTKRGEAGTGLNGGVQVSKRKRSGSVHITIEAARAVVAILECIARKHNAPPVPMDTLDDSKLLSLIIDMRAGELRDVLMK